jgi:hypothetical protein
LSLAERIEIKNLRRATPDLVISQSLSSRIETPVNKFNRAMYAKHDKLSECAERNMVLGLLINGIIILVPAVP